MDAEVSTHTFLTMIIEESVCFMSCEPILFCNYSYVVHMEYIYIFFSSTEHCAWAIISPKEFKSCVTCISSALLYWKTEFICYQIFCNLLLKSAFEWIFNVIQLILVKIKWHIKWKYLIFSVVFLRRVLKYHITLHTSIIYLYINIFLCL